MERGIVNKAAVNHIVDFLGGLVADNLPANGGDMGSIPGLGGFHMPQGN